MEGCWGRALYIMLEDVETFVDGLLCGVDLVEKVATKEEEVSMLFGGNFENLFEGVE